MANTIIQLKHSTVTGNVPASLANGEISINSRDGKLFYSTPLGVVTEFNPATGPSGLDTEVQFNDSGTTGANAGLTFDKTSGVLTVGSGVIAAGVNLTSKLSSAFDQANTALDVGTSAGIYANGAFTKANAAFEKANTSGQTITISSAPPASGNANGSIWVDTADGTEYTWVTDVDGGSQWVELGPAPTLVASNLFDADGGFASSTYLITQKINGGTA